MEGKFHSLSVHEVEKHFGVDRFFGLSEKRAEANRSKFGPNSFDELKEGSAWQIFVRQFANFFILLLFVAAAISYFVDGPLQSGILIIIILVNVLLGFIQENKAEKALSALKQSYVAKSKVLRDGAVRVVSNSELTLGDVVVLESGDKVPADLRIIEEESLRVDEAVLTGESVPLSKSTHTLPDSTPLADRRNILYASTHVAAGRGRGVVVAIGRRTEFGKVAGLIQKTEEKTPLEKQIAYIAKFSTAVFFLMAILIFGLGFWRGEAVLPLLTFTIALLVAAVPESLPTAITLALALGVSRMVKQRSIVRRMAAVETLGAVNIIATDKTGTLTDNQLTVDTISLWQRGNWQRNDFSKRSHLDPEIRDFLIRAALCSNVTAEDAREFIGDPVEVAIVQRLMNTIPKTAGELRSYSRLFEIPFDSDRKYMAVLVRHRGRSELIVKGMPERLIHFCNLSPRAKESALSEAAALSRAGFKVLALAIKPSAGSSKVLSDLKLLGFLALIDEPAEGVTEAIGQAMRAGIRPVIVTGDHPETARYIANKIGLKVSPAEIVSEIKLEQTSPAELKKLITHTKIFARITPEDKINIVKAFEDSGYVVAVTGDGVNDAPALKEADVGVAMGQKGTDVAREASDIVLADDKYGTIITSVEYGRSIYDNIRGVLIFLLSGNFDELLLVVTVFILDLPLPLFTLQILWINLVTDSLPAFAFAFEKPNANTLREKPRLVSTQSMRGPIIHSAILALVAFSLTLPFYFWGLEDSIGKARTMIFILSIFHELAFAFSLRTKFYIWTNPKEFFANRFMLASIAGAVGLTVLLFLTNLGRIFGLVQLSLVEVGILVLCALTAFLACEATKLYFVSDQRRQSGLQSRNGPKKLLNSNQVAT